MAWPISMPFVGSMGCTPEVREQAGTAMVRQLVRSDRAVTVRAPSSHPVGDDGRKQMVEHDFLESRACQTCQTCQV